MVIADERMYVDGSTEKIADNVTQLEMLTNGVLDLSITPHAIAHCNELVTLDKDLKKVKASLSAQSKTAKLWIQFLEYIKVIKDLISFERLGMWENHLLTVSKFLNLFAATGHIYTILRVLDCIFKKCRNCLLLTRGCTANSLRMASIL